MLRIENLSKRHGDHLVFQALTHTFSAGCTALCEQDSTGKSSLLDIIAGIVAPDSGDVWIDGHSMAHAPRQARARLAHVPGKCRQEEHTSALQSSMRNSDYVFRL